MRTPLRAMLTGLVLLHTGAAFAGPYELSYENDNGSTWFGGDDRKCCGPRHVGAGQSVLVDTAIQLQTFSFAFTGRFDYSGNPEGIGHEVTVVLQVWTEAGDPLATTKTVVPDTFDGGWVVWSGIDAPVAANSTVVFTAYVVGAYDTNQYDSGIRTDFDGGYPDGGRYGGGGTSDEEMGMWATWSGPSSTADYIFRLTGDHATPVEHASWGDVKTRYVLAPWGDTGS